jgi:hypothetical protein
MEAPIKANKKIAEARNMLGETNRSEAKQSAT